MKKLNTIPNNNAIPELMANANRLSDGGSLYLIKGKTPDRFFWRFDYSFGASRKTLSAGVFPDTTLDEARAAATEFRNLLAQGSDPSALRKEMGRQWSAQRKDTAALKRLGIVAGSFAAAAHTWFELRKGDWVCDYANKVLGRIKKYLLPKFGARQITELGPSDITALCRSIQASGRVETGIRVFKICKRIMDLAIAEEQISVNPCNSVLEALQTPVTRHYPAIIDPMQLANLLRKIHQYRGTAVVRAALELNAMLMVRGGELRKAQWGEFDLNRGEWRVPAIRMKGQQHRKLYGPPHIVPLPDQAVRILRGLFNQRNDSQYVFPAKGRTDRCMSGGTLNRALKIMGYSTSTEVTAHGFRPTARTMLVERLGWNKDIAELQLAHTVPDQNGTAYNRVQHLKERRQMLQAWADYLDDLREGCICPDQDEDKFTPITEAVLDKQEAQACEPRHLPSETFANEYWFQKPIRFQVQTMKSPTQFELPNISKCQSRWSQS
ncbi:tyrosine-type recombinase/integrase [Rhodoferax sp. U2-2l]|uniref:tyrosine-type recombinase/integrase n=1 Tax=Rhodoferax sp. U2-2l TaxID=2884000 RepID=UPI001D09AA61|nr:site-specific integrase [Rhodoferax sp. U2-2l]MCB8748937.1 tyrosine-type recombinase/integrase [Rhodoferax sp. U2-2l]